MANEALRILMVEDNADDADLVTFNLKRAGIHCVVERVQTRGELESALNTRRPAAILCDLNLPFFSGLEAVDIVYRLAPDIPFLFFSGSDQGPMADAVRSRSGTTIFSKDNCRHIVSVLKKLTTSDSVNTATPDGHYEANMAASAKPVQVVSPTA